MLGKPTDHVQVFQCRLTKNLRLCKLQPTLDYPKLPRTCTAARNSGKIVPAFVPLYLIPGSHLNDTHSSQLRRQDLCDEPEVFSLLPGIYHPNTSKKTSKIKLMWSPSSGLDTEINLEQNTPKPPDGERGSTKTNHRYPGPEGQDKIFTQM